MINIKCLESKAIHKKSQFRPKINRNLNNVINKNNSKIKH